MDQPVALVDHVKDLTLKPSVSEYDPCAGTGLFSGLYKAFPDIVFPALQKQDFDQGAGFLLVSVKPGRNDLGIVDHQTVSRLHIVQNIREMSVLDAAVLQRQMKKPG